MLSILNHLSAITILARCITQMAALFAPPSPSQNRKQKEYVNGIIREFLIEYSVDFLRSTARQCI